ncbi:hypothetical protein BT96DRAFT_916506 [Gymnopus androsaceus JB14]|uniref:Uncharacterized protein n=1 Tax=Gymnopus androsaceus JB14 TaxID=1447944 RepID=A0A6A4I4F0_9AGAR|nr:hypothetical protein BT96DRAFT_916506 [Gymnopus androsaceus JB14]
MGSDEDVALSKPFVPPNFAAIQTTQNLPRIPPAIHHAPLFVPSPSDCILALSSFFIVPVSCANK